MYPTTRLQANGQVTLPHQLRDEMDLEAGDALVWVKNEAGHWEVWSKDSLAEVFAVAD